MRAWPLWHLLLVALACGAPASSRQALERHRRWRGSAAGTVVGTVVLEGQVSVYGQSGRTELVVGPDGSFRETVELGGISRVGVSGPEGAFTVNLSGAVEPMAEHDRRAMQRRLARLLGRPGVPGSKVTPVGRRRRDGRDWDVVRVDAGGDASDELYIDPGDGSLTWVHTRDDTDSGWEKLGDWEDAGGARVPRREESYGEDGKLESAVTWTRVDAGATIDAATFGRPAARGLALAFAGGAAGTGWMPFELRNDKILIRGRVGDHPADLLLDSGAGISVIDSKLAGALALPRLGQVRLAGTGAEQQADLVGPLSVHIGDLTVSGVVAVAIDLGIVGDRPGAELPVIVGKELFNSAVVDADFPRRRIAFHAPDRYRYEGPGAAVPVLPTENGLVAVELSVGASPPGLFQLDTGGAGTLDVFPWFVDKHHLLDGLRTTQRKSGGIGGFYLSRMARVPTVTLAGQTFRDVPVMIPDVKEGGFHTRRLAGNLGAALLARFRLVFQYARGVVVFEPGADAGRPFERDRSGLQLDRRSGEVEVLFVAPGSPAAAAGWKEHDRLVSIDGKPVNDLDDDALRSWARRPAGTRVKLVDGAGRARDLVLADYF